LSFTLQAILTQQLIPAKDGKSRLLATELLIPTVAIRSLIRQDKIHQIYSSMQTGQEETSMYTMNQNLAKYVASGALSAQDAIEYSTEPEELSKMLGIAPARANG